MATPNLAGLLTKPTRTPEKEAPPAAPQPDIPASSEDQATNKPPDKGRRAPRRAADESARTVEQDQPSSRRQYLRSITIYLPRSVHQQVATAAVARETTHTALILTAINATHARIAAALASQTAPIASRDLFDIPQDRGPAEPSVQTTIRVTDSQLQAMETLAASHETNRSHLITAALRLYLN
jgi:hypothetical protein